MSEQNKSILQQANAAIRTGDIEGFLRHCAEDIVWTTVGDSTLRGKGAVREWMVTNYVKPPTFTVNDLVAEGEFVIALGEITTEDDAGRSVRNAYADVWRVRGGLLAELRAFVVVD